MNYLLDTHTLLWFLDQKQRLSAVALEAIENLQSNCYCSIASLWEITIKRNQGKLEVPFTLETLDTYFYENRIRVFPIRVTDLRVYQSLPLHHRDPFDRMLISQAIANHFTLISKDPQFSNYPVKLLW